MNYLTTSGIKDFEPLEILINRLEYNKVETNDNNLIISFIPWSKKYLNYLDNLNHAIQLIPDGWWFHISHLEVSVNPTSNVGNLPITISNDYRLNGRPVEYKHHLWGDKNKISKAICIAVLRARLASIIKNEAVLTKRRYVVQTGNGPMFADLDGSLKELPYNTWIQHDTGEWLTYKDSNNLRTFFKDLKEIDYPEEDNEEEI
jgi:hypothetical protein